MATLEKLTEYLRLRAIAAQFAYDDDELYSLILSLFPSGISDRDARKLLEEEQTPRSDGDE